MMPANLAMSDHRVTVPVRAGPVDVEGLTIAAALLADLVPFFPRSRAHVGAFCLPAERLASAETEETVMKGLDDRHKGFEAEFARGEELTFRITAGRDRLLGLWAAERPTEAYAKTVVEADFQVPGDDDVVEKVRGDLAAKGLDITEAEVRAQLTRAAARAREQLAGR